MEVFWEHFLAFAILMDVNILICRNGEIWALFFVKLLKRHESLQNKKKKLILLLFHVHVNQYVLVFS